MPQPARHTAAGCWLLAAIVLPSLAAGQSILGIDWGTAWVKAAVLKNNEFTIVLNEATQRKSSAAIGFDNGERVFGDAAASLRGRVPDSVFSGFHHLLAVSPSHPAAQRLDGNPSVQFKMDTAGVRCGLVNGDGDKFGPEEVMGMSLYFMSRMASANTKRNISSCVITVPVHMTAQARAGMVQAGEIVGVKVEGVVNDYAALAVQYAKERKWSTNPGEVERVLLVDVGAAFTRASVVEYSLSAGKKQTITIKSAVSDQEVGGGMVDLRLAELLAERFQQLHKTLDIRNNPRAFAKVLREAEKIKRRLSANDETSVSIGSLINDLDFQTKVTRQELERLLTDLKDRVGVPIQQALAQAQLPAGTTVDLAMPFGAGWRFPMIKEAIEAVPGVGNLKNFINTDEAVALGAAFIHANVSGQVRVRELLLRDLVPVPSCQKDCAPPLTPHQIQQARSRHQQMCKAEQEREELEFAKSEFEAWLYASKELIMREDDESPAYQVISPEQAETLTASLDQAEEWLYDTPWDELTVQQLVVKKSQLFPAVAAIQTRIDEYDARPGVIQALRNGIANALSKAHDWKETRPHIPQTKLEQLSELSTAAQEWLTSSQQALEKVGLFADPPFKSEQVKQKLSEIKDLIDTLRLIKPQRNGANKDDI